MYNPNRLEWHLGDERQKRFITPQGTVWSCRVVSDWDFSLLTNRFAAALAKSQDHRVIYGVFCVWRLCNAVRRWLHLGIPCYTSELKQGRWAKDRAEWLGRKSQKSVRCDAMTWLRRGSYPQAERKLGFDSVRLCFAQTITKGEL